MGDVYVNPVPESLALSSRRSGELLILYVSGELDAATAELLDPAIRAAERSDAKTISIELREVSFIDSVGLSLLCEARRRCERIGFIPSDHDQVARLIALTETEDLLGYPLVGEPAD